MCAQLDRRKALKEKKKKIMTRIYGRGVTLSAEVSSKSDGINKETLTKRHQGVWMFNAQTQISLPRNRIAIISRHELSIV